MHPALQSYLNNKLTLSPAHQSLVNQSFTEKTTTKNEILVPAGAIVRHLYFVISGCLRIFLKNNEGIESTRFLIFERQWAPHSPPSSPALQPPLPYKAPNRPNSS